MFGRQSAMEKFEERIDAKFAKLEERLDAKFANIDANFANIDANFANIDANFANIDAKFRTQNFCFFLIAIGMIIGFKNLRSIRIDIEGLVSGMRGVCGDIAGLRRDINKLQLSVNPYFVREINDRHPIVAYEDFGNSVVGKRGHVFSFMKTDNRDVSESGIIAVGCVHGTFDGSFPGACVPGFLPLDLPQSLVELEIKTVFVHDPSKWNHLVATDLVVLGLGSLPPGLDVDKLPSYEERMQVEPSPDHSKAAYTVTEGIPIYARTSTGYLTGHTMIRQYDGLIEDEDPKLFYIMCMEGSVEVKNGDSGSLFHTLAADNGESTKPFGVLYGSRDENWRIVVAPLVPFEDLISLTIVIDGYDSFKQQHFVGNEAVELTWEVRNLFLLVERPARPIQPMPSRKVEKEFISNDSTKYGIFVNRGDHDWSHYDARVLEKREEGKAKRQQNFDQNNASEDSDRHSSTTQSEMVFLPSPNGSDQSINPSSVGITSDEEQATSETMRSWNPMLSSIEKKD